MYRAALALRRKLQTQDSRVVFLDPTADDILYFQRSNGWRCITNFSGADQRLPRGEILLSSGSSDQGDVLPPETTIWLLGPSQTHN